MTQSYNAYAIFEMNTWRHAPYYIMTPPWQDLSRHSLLDPFYLDNPYLDFSSLNSFQLVILNNARQHIQMNRYEFNFNFTITHPISKSATLVQKTLEQEATSYSSKTIQKELYDTRSPYCSRRIRNSFTK